MELQKNITYLAKKYSEIENIQLEELAFMDGIKKLDQIAKRSGYLIENLLSIDIEKKEKLNPKDIKLLALDVDGVMTDGGMYYTESGDEFKKYNTKDGMSIRSLTSNGFEVCILSSGFNKNLIKRRAELLGINKIFVGRGKKIEILREWCKELDININNVAYIGDDINDLEIIKEVGLSACPQDAVKIVKQNTNFVLQSKGGKGCIREFIDTYIKETR